MARASGSRAHALSIEQKLPLLISALLLVTLLGATWAAYAEVKRAALERVSERLRSATRQLADISQASTAQRVALIGRVAADTAIRSVLRSAGTLALTPAATTALRRLATPTDSTVVVEVWDARGNRRAAAGRPVAPAHAQQALRVIRVTGAADSVRTGSFYVAGDSIFGWTVAPVRDEETVLGYLARRGRLANPPQAERQIRTLIGQDITVYAADTAGGFWATLGGVPSAPPRTLRSLPSGLFEYVDGGGAARMGARARVAGTPWVLMLVMPRAAALERPRAFLRRMMLAAALIVLLAAAGAWAVSRHITRPLGALVGAAEAIAAGDYGRRVAVQRRDEVGRLGETFNVMAERVGESHTALKHQAAALHDSNDQLAEQALELELSNQQLQDQAAELEAQTEELQATAAQLEQRTEEAERAAAALRESEGQFRAMANVIPTLAWTARPDGHIDWYNARWYEYTGTTPEEMAGWGWQSVHDPDELPRVLERWTTSIATGQPFEMEFPLKSATGRFRSFLTRVAPLWDADGRVTRWFGTNTDVEAHREAAAESARLHAAEREARLRAEESERRFRKTADAAPVLIWTSGPDARCDWFNAPWLAYSGRAMDQVVGNGWIEDVHPDDVERCLATYLGAFHAHEPFSMEYRLRRHDGVYRWFLDNAVPRFAETGAFVGYIGTCSDVTDPRLARETAEAAHAEAEAARSVAEAANRAKSQFLSTMSHELRTPLNAIGGYAELLELGIRGPVTDAQRQDLGRIRRASQHLTGLINDILNFARLEAGQVEFHFEDVRLGPLVADVESLVGPQLAAKGLAYGPDGCVPDTPDRPHMVRADPEKVRQVLLNLLTNALKFTDAGGRVTLMCDHDSTEGAVRVRVSDTGRGIPGDQLERVFEPFVQVDRHRTHESQQGVGLGLSISRDLARGMGGDLTAESTPGAGSTFTLTLPRA